MSPIRPENRKRYPSDWRLIRSRILERAGFRCECRGECGRAHGGTSGLFPEPGRCSEEHGHVAREANGVVFLTIAHLDHVPENCSPENLRAFCQRCHLRYDAPEHARNAAATRRAKRATGDLFDHVTEAP